MKRVTLGSMLLVMTFSTTVLAAVAGPRWRFPVGDPEPGLRCPNDIDEPMWGAPFPKVHERIDWSIECSVIHPSRRTLFLYDFDDDGNRVERPVPLYPTFGHMDSAGHFTELWKPDVTRDAEGHFVDCSIPPDVGWYGNCLPF